MTRDVPSISLVAFLGLYADGEIYLLVRACVCVLMLRAARHLRLPISMVNEFIFDSNICIMASQIIQRVFLSLSLRQVFFFSLSPHF